MSWEVFEGKGRQDETNNPSVLACVTLTHLLYTPHPHPLNKGDHVKHLSPSPRLSSSSLTEPRLFKREKDESAPLSPKQPAHEVPVLLKTPLGPPVLSRELCFNVRQHLSNKTTRHPSGFNQHQTCSESTSKLNIWDLEVNPHVCFHSQAWIECNWTALVFEDVSALTPVGFFSSREKFQKNVTVDSWHVPPM